MSTLLKVSLMSTSSKTEFLHQVVLLYSAGNGRQGNKSSSSVLGAAVNAGSSRVKTTCGCGARQTGRCPKTSYRLVQAAGQVGVVEWGALRWLVAI